MDLAILTGTSPAVDADSKFEAQKTLIKEVLGQYDLSRDKTLVSFVSRDTQPVLLSKLGDITDRNTAINFVNTMKNPKKSGDLDGYLSFIKETVFSLKQGARANVPKSILIFEDSKRTGDKADEVSQSLKDKKMKLVIVGLGNDIDKNNLEKLGDKESIFFPPELESIGAVGKPVARALRPGK